MSLLFLMRLQHVQLPVRVSCPEEIRHVSVLVATGLIEAEIRPLKTTEPYARSGVATVVRITEHGLAEIAKMGDASTLGKTAMQFSRGFRLM